jgi:hypothetical protein
VAHIPCLQLNLAFVWKERGTLLRLNQFEVITLQHVSSCKEINETSTTDHHLQAFFRRCCSAVGHSLLLVSVIEVTATAQQITGVPGSPGATVTLDRSSFPRHRGFLRYESVMGPENATIDTILSDNGYATSWFTKDQNITCYQHTVAGS